jgi:hypothetical protein
MSTPKLARAILIDFESQLLNAALDGGLIADLLILPRFTLNRVIKTVDGIVLINHANGITHMTDVQTTLGAMAATMEKLQQARGMKMEQARTQLAPLVAEVPKLLEWLKQLDAFVSPFGDLWK